eukprot:6212677-Pleurochrysis_carterae.AAC.4
MQVTCVESKVESSEKCIVEALRAEFGRARRRTQQRRWYDRAAAPLLATVATLLRTYYLWLRTQLLPVICLCLPRTCLYNIWVLHTPALRTVFSNVCGSLRINVNGQRRLDFRKQSQAWAI